MTKNCGIPYSIHGLWKELKAEKRTQGKAWIIITFDDFYDGIASIWTDVSCLVVGQQWQHLMEQARHSLPQPQAVKKLKLDPSAFQSPEFWCLQLRIALT
jgi:hypothetical protein